MFDKIYFLIAIATTHYQSTHPSTNYPSSYYTPAQTKPHAIPTMVQAPATQSSALPSHHNVPPLTATTTTYNSIASPFDIPSLGCVTTTTVAQSSWPDLMSNSYSSTSSSANSNNSRTTRPVSSLPAHQPPLVFPSNPEPFQGMKII